MDGGACNPRILRCTSRQIAEDTISLLMDNQILLEHYMHPNYGPCGSEISLTSYNQPISFLTWHHVVITADGNTGEGKLYLDGILVNSVSGPTFSNMFYNGTDLIIGNIDPSRCDWWGGKIDDLAFWDRTLTSQVQQLNNNFSHSDILWSTGDTTSSITVSQIKQQHIGLVKMDVLIVLL